MSHRTKLDLTTEKRSSIPNCVLPLCHAEVRPVTRPGGKIPGVMVWTQSKPRERHRVAAIGHMAV